MASPSTSPEPHPGPAKPRSLRAFNRIGCLLLIVVLVTFLVVSYLAQTSASERQLQREIARLKAAGILLEPEDLIPTVPEGEKNAADVYRRAFSARQVSQAESETIDAEPGQDPSRMDTVRDVVARHTRYFDLLDEASRIPTCAFPVDWRHRASAVFPHPTDMREADRMLALRAEVLAAHGDHDGALACIATSLRIADHAGSEPSIIGQFVAYAMRDIALDSLEATLSSGTPTPEACRRLFDQLSAIDQVSPSICATQAEAIFLDLPLFDQVRSRQLSGGDLVQLAGSTLDEVAARLYPTVGSSLVNLDEITYLQCVEESLSALREPYPVLQQMLAQAEARVDQAPTYHTLLTRGMEPISVARRLGQSRERVAALISVAQIALAATAYHAERGRYPSSLADLQAAGWDLPKDPFTFPEAEFHYARERDGFRIWSVEPDMDYDAGVDMEVRLGAGLSEE
jgi:hypothetical protein